MMKNRSWSRASTPSPFFCIHTPRNPVGTGAGAADDVMVALRDTESVGVDVAGADGADDGDDATEGSADALGGGMGSPEGGGGRDVGGPPRDVVRGAREVVETVRPTAAPAVAAAGARERTLARAASGLEAALMAVAHCCAICGVSASSFHVRSMFTIVRCAPVHSTRVLASTRKSPF